MSKFCKPLWVCFEVGTVNAKVLPFDSKNAEYYPALIPDGEYTLAYCRHKIVRRFERDVLELWFTVMDFGEHYGKQVIRYYSVQASAKRRSFTARPGSDFVLDYARVFGQRPRFNMAPLERFKSCLVAGRVETVKQNHRQRTLPEVMRYSKVGALLRKVEG